jgi:hypothetical protein
MNFKKSWDIDFQKILHHDFYFLFLKFNDHDFQKFKELCFDFYLFIDFV